MCPTYVYSCDNPKCKEFEKEEDVFHSVDEKPEITCGFCKKTKIKLIGKGVSFIQRGWGWPTKDFKTKKERLEKSKYLGKKQWERWGDKVKKSEPVPNVDGERFGSWKDASIRASEKGYDPRGYFRKDEEAVKRKEKIERVKVG